MAQSVSVSHGTKAHSEATQAPAQGRDQTSPWLAITGPLIIALSVLIVSMLSKASF